MPCQQTLCGRNPAISRKRSPLNILAAMLALAAPGAVPPAAPEVAQTDTAIAASPAAPPAPTLPLAEAATPVPLSTQAASAPLPATPAEHDTIVVTGTGRPPANDPLRGVNAASFAVTQDVDRSLVAPVAMTYKQIMPDPLRAGLRNALRNVGEPVIALNFLLQIKPGKAAETVGRFIINSTLGVGGLFDMAKRRPINLPRRPNGFAYTMGFYGIKPGPFLFIPLIGPTTLRDAIGGGLDRLVVPMAVGAPFNTAAYSVSTSVLSTLDRRVEIDEQIHRLRDGNPDPYASFRAFYLDKRQTEIDELRGVHKNVTLPTAPAPAASAPAASSP